MTNYWLSEFDDKNLLNESRHEDDEEKGEEEPEGRDVKASLSSRQQMMYENYESVVEEFGIFKQDSKADGAHYAPASANPFKEEGMICANCVFYIGGGACEIVKGVIESEAICKLWIIPQELIK